MKYVVTSHVDVGNNSQKLMDTYTLMSWVSEKLIFFNQNMLKEISSAFGADLSDASTLATNQGAMHHSLV